MKTHLAFTDYKKAFDSINRNKLMEILIEGNIPNQLIMSMYEAYTHNLVAVKTLSQFSEWKEINTGMTESCSLSLFFIIYIYIYI
jgi:hypothetical protein